MFFDNNNLYILHERMLMSGRVHGFLSLSISRVSLLVGVLMCTLFFCAIAHKLFGIERRNIKKSRPCWRTLS